MDVIPNTYIPGDSRLIQQLVYELKSQGIFDQFRKECISDVDTKPAYQNLRQRVEGSVSAFLKEQTWSADMNKNQVREQLRKNIYESGYLDTGVERIVDQVVNPKINTVFVPQVEDVVYRYLGVEKPSKEVKKEPVTTDLLPTDLEAVSPESVQSYKTEEEKKDDSDIMNDSQNDSINSKADEDESPPFEPLENNPSSQPIIQQEENSGDSQLSGFSGLQSHESNHADANTGQNGSQMDWSYQDSQDMSQNSFDSRQSLGNSDTKMEICEDSESKSLKSSDTNSKTENGSKLYMEDSLDNDHSMDNLIIDETVGTKFKEIVSETKKSDDKLKNEKKSEEKRNRDKKDEDKKRSEDKRSRNSDKSSSKDKKEDKYKKDDKYSASSKERDRSSSKHSSSSKEKPSTSSSTSSRDKEKSKDDKNSKEKSSVSTKEKNKESKDYKSDPNTEKGKTDKDKYKMEKDKSKDKYKEKDKGKLEDKSIKEKEKPSKRDKDKSEKGKEKSSKDKEKSDKDKYKEKSNKDKTDKSKDKSDKKKKEEKYDNSKDKSRDKTDTKKSDKDKTDRYKEKSEHKDRDRTEKDKNKNSNHKNTSKDKDRDRSVSSSSSLKKESSTKRKDKSDSSVANSKLDADSETKTKKEKNEKHDGDTPSPKKSKRDPKKEPKDDHYSFKDKKNDRRSFDRDSNDGHSSKKSQNYSISLSERTQPSYQDSSSSYSGSGSGDSRNSDTVEKLCVDNTDVTENQENAVKESIVVSDIQAIKYIKPKFASNFEEARKIMKIRKQLAWLEKQNKLSLAQVEMTRPVENGNVEEYKQNDILPSGENRSLRINLLKEVMQEVTSSDKENSDSSSEKPKNVEKKRPISPKILPEKKITSLAQEISKPIVEIPVTVSPKKIISLQSTNLSKENWEALEARLAQEMSNLDYGSYESHYDDYDDIGYTPVVVSPRKNIVITLAEDVKRKNSQIKEEKSDIIINKVDSNLDKKDIEVSNEDSLKHKIEKNAEDVNINTQNHLKDKKMLENEIVEQVKSHEECKESAESKEEKMEENVPEVVENLVNNEVVEELVGDADSSDEVPLEKYVEDSIETNNRFDKDEVKEVFIENKDEEKEHDTKKICLTLEEIQSNEFEKLKQNNDITVIEVANTELCEGEIEVAQMYEDQIESITASLVIVNAQDKTKDSETCETSKSDDLCRYLEKPDSLLQHNLQYLYKYIFNLENEIERNIKLSQNNLLPAKRGRKRKFNENADFKNNNEMNFNQTVVEVKRPRGRPPKANSDVSNSSKDKSCNSTDISPQNFSFPLSPAESEKSFDKKEEEINPIKPKQKKAVGKTSATKRLQRYSSEDLYKPRTLLGLSSRRSRGAKN